MTPAEMDSQPHGFPIRVRSLHAVTHMAGNQEVIAGRERDLPAVKESEQGAPLHQQHPLIRLLVVPESRRRRLTPGDDPLDPEGVRSEDLSNQSPPASPRGYP